MVIVGSPAWATDLDGDGIPDGIDNCLAVANGGPLGCDTDRDGFGNACDGDFDGSGSTSSGDFTTIFLPDYVAGSDSGGGTDMDCDGVVSAGDFSSYFIPSFILGIPGASGLSPQRTFLWHSGDATIVDTAGDVANPFRGRVAPSGLRGTTGDVLDSAIRFFEGDDNLILAPGQTLVVDQLDPQLSRIKNAPATVLTDIGNLVLSNTFPSNRMTGFGGDFGGVFCVDPYDPAFQPILDGTAAPPAGARCIRGSTDTADGTTYTDASVLGFTKMAGGIGELPFRPGPDVATLGRVVIDENGSEIGPAPDAAGVAKGLFYLTRGMRLAAAMQFERAVDPTSGRPLVARLLGEPLESCGAAHAGEVVSRSFFGTEIFYSTGFASHPLSMTPGARDAASTAVRGGIGRDSGCLRPGGARSEPNQFGFDEAEDAIDSTNALYQHHADQARFAEICDAALPFESSLASDACVWTLLSSTSVLSQQFLNVPFVELLAPVLAGEQTGGNGGPHQFLGLTQNAQKFSAADVTAPLAPLNRLPNLFFSPIFDRNGDGLLNADGCDDPDPAVRYDCDLRGFDGFDTRTAAVDRTNVPTTLDASLTNEQRALFGCGPLYGTRCDSSVASGQYGAFGGLDFLNAEASAVLESVRTPDDAATTTASSAQPGTVDYGTSACARMLEDGSIVRLPGCRGLASVEVVLDASQQPIRVDAVFEPGYLPSQDGCVLGTRIFRSSTGQYVPVQATGGAPEMAAELALCDTALTRSPVPQLRLDGFQANGSPIQTPNPACSGSASGGIWDGINYKLCNAESSTVEARPLIHPLASCADSDVWFANGGNGQGGCEFYYGRDLVEEFLAGKAQLFRSESAAVSWNLVTFLVVTSCDANTPDESGETHTIPFYGSAQQGLASDLQCFDAENPYEPSRCSYANPQLCKNVRFFLDQTVPIALQ